MVEKNKKLFLPTSPDCFERLAEKMQLCNFFPPLNTQIIFRPPRPDGNGENVRKVAI
jgi:hypothetical protein